MKGDTALDKIKTQDLFACNTPYLQDLFAACEYPWELLAGLKEYLAKLIQNGIPGYEEIADGVWVGENVKIYPNVTIEGPAVIGAGSELRPGAFLRGNVITGEKCVLGNSSEFKHCILLDGVQAPHYNYVGDSVLGNRAHLGAGSICSNLKADGKNVVIHGETDYETGLRKLGGILADGADVGCSCVLNPGCVIGKNTSVYPMNALRGIFPPDCIVKAQENVVKRI